MSACQDEVTDDACSDDPVATVAGTTYEGSLDVDVALLTEQAPGVFVRDLIDGNGDEAVAGSSLRVRYAAALTYRRTSSKRSEPMPARKPG